jgi:transposase InsO family protein
MFGSLIRLLVLPGSVREIALGNLAFRQQLTVFKRRCPHPDCEWQIGCSGYASPGTGRTGRPEPSPEVRALIRKMAATNPFWGAPRIHEELLKLGFEISERSVSRLVPKNRKPPSQTWKTFVENHANRLVSMDFFTVPTATFRVLFVLVVLTHRRRSVAHFNVTEHPTAEWVAQQLREAFPDDRAPRYLIRDRDRVYGERFQDRAGETGITEVLTAPQNPWQNAFAERLIGSIRRECLDHVIVLGEKHLRKILRIYFENSAIAHSFIAGQGCSLPTRCTTAGAWGSGCGSPKFHLLKGH